MGGAARRVVTPHLGAGRSVATGEVPPPQHPPVGNGSASLGTDTHGWDREGAEQVGAPLCHGRERARHLCPVYLAVGCRMRHPRRSGRPKVQGLHPAFGVL